MILVTGATGNVGREVVAQLLDAGAGVRAVTREPNAAELPTGVDVVRGDLSDPATLEAHLGGIDGVFLVWPFVRPQQASELAPAVVRTIARHAQRIVYLSAHAATQAGSFWAIVEQAIEGSGLDWTFLRPTGFASNTRIWADQIRGGDVVRWPYGDAARSLIHERDIAAVAARALTGDGHAGATYVLTGPATVTQAEQVRAIGEAIGRPLRFEEVPGEAVRDDLVAAMGDPAFADGALKAWGALVDQPEIVTATVQEVTGAPAASADGPRTTSTSSEQESARHARRRGEAIRWARGAGGERGTRSGRGTRAGGGRGLRRARPVRRNAGPERLGS